ncbi:MAG: hypothetical protein LBG87_09100 [Spirochaetaceae bacterium]|nr:hypothetical protein [Spirochaetaceae bacterium]
MRKTARNIYCRYRLSCLWLFAADSGEYSITNIGNFNWGSGRCGGEVFFQPER